MQTKRLDTLTLGGLGLALGVLVVGLFLGLKAPPDANQGWLSRMLYIHPPVAWVAYLAFFVAAGYGIAYLVRGKAHHDRMTAAAVELGLLFAGLAIVSGMLWSRPTWGVYWTWEPRLTTTAIMFVVYVGYMVVRGVIEDPELRAKAGSAIAILGSINVPISYMSVKWWRSLHQTQSLDITTGKVSMQSEMLVAMLISLLAYSLLFLVMLRLRGMVLSREARQEALKLEVQHG
jgi:heme exporter protein C